MTSRRLDSLLNNPSGSSLASIAKRAKSMNSLRDRLVDGLDEALARGIVSANLRDDGELVVLCRSAAHAAKLRFASEGLLEAAVSGGYAARSVKVRVARDSQG